MSAKDDLDRLDGEWENHLRWRKGRTHMGGTAPAGQYRYGKDLALRLSELPTRVRESFVKDIESIVAAELDARYKSERARDSKTRTRAFGRLTMSAGSVTKPPALTAELSQSCNDAETDGATAFEVKISALRELIAMAERSVSEETLRKLASLLAHAEADDEAGAQAAGEAFGASCIAELHEAATRLRQGGDGNG